MIVKPSVYLEKDTLHVWLVDPNQTWDFRTEKAWRASLCTDETARMARFVTEQDRRRYLCAHGMLRYLLSAYFPTIKPETWRFAPGIHGRPALVNEPAGITFNLSHTKGCIALAFARNCRLGVDIERRGGHTDLDIARTFFADFEYKALKALPPEMQADRFLCLWTLKEAYLKALGVGLSLPLDAISFQFSGCELTDYQITTPEVEARLQWTFHIGDAEAEHRIALAWSDEFPACRRTVRFFRMTPPVARTEDLPLVNTEVNAPSLAYCAQYDGFSGLALEQA